MELVGGRSIWGGSSPTAVTPLMFSRKSRRYVRRRWLHRTCDQRTLVLHCCHQRVLVSRQSLWDLGLFGLQYEYAEWLVAFDIWMWSKGNMAVVELVSLLHENCHQGVLTLPHRSCLPGGIQVSSKLSSRRSTSEFGWLGLERECGECSDHRPIIAKQSLCCCCGTQHFFNTGLLSLPPLALPPWSPQVAEACYHFHNHHHQHFHHDHQRHKCYSAYVYVCLHSSTPTAYLRVIAAKRQRGRVRSFWRWHIWHN